MALPLPTLYVVRAEYSAAMVRPRLPSEMLLLNRTLEELQEHAVACTEAADRLTAEKASLLFAHAADAASDVSGAFSADSFIMRLAHWSRPGRFADWLPYSSGLDAVYAASTATRLATVDMNYKLRGFMFFCHKRVELLGFSTDDGDSRDLLASITEEEQRNQAWINEQVPRLRALHRNLLEAKKVFDRDSPKLTALAWSLGTLQLVGWPLIFFVLFPRELRLYRQRREAAAASAKKKGA